MRFAMSRGRLHIDLRVFRQGRDIQVLCQGGAAHLGAVALAVPSTEGTGKSAEVQAQLLVLPGHREDAIALGMARRMAAELRCAVCVSAGIHYNDITREEIRQVEAMAQALTERCLISLKKDASCSR